MRTSQYVFAPSDLIQANGAVPDPANFEGFMIKISGEAKEPDKSVKLELKEAAAGVHLPEVVISEHINFGGAEARTNLNWFYVGDWWNDKISSIIVVSGTWRFYEHAHYQGRFWDLRPGYYPWVVDVGIPNDIISSFQAIGF